MRKSTVNAVELGTNTDRSKNIVLSVPNAPDGSFVLTRGYLNDDGSVVGTAVLSGSATGVISLNGQVVSASTTNTVTNKVAMSINGTTYYLLASTSGT